MCIRDRINDVLDMSKIESGKITPNIGPMLLPELIENVVTIMQPDIKAKNPVSYTHLDVYKRQPERRCWRI